jgi:phage tail-like protein
MAEISNPHKKFQFSIFLMGMNPFLAQKVKLADRDIDQVEHGEGNHLVKTAGMLKLGNVTIDKISNSSIPDKLMWAWIHSIQDEFTGGGAPPAIYKLGMQVQKLATDGATVIGTWNYIGAWPCKINGVELDRMSSDNTIESLEFSVDKELYV